MPDGGAEATVKAEIAYEQLFGSFVSYPLDAAFELRRKGMVVR